MMAPEAETSSQQ